jgi:hypothetical protein
VTQRLRLDVPLMETTVWSVSDRIQIGL